ncbi:enoyl-CoA hydratase-related protein [Rhizorhabdus wittichii]|uniref:enoyl-CoA hydratase-related protein n=1 Tax=Rhizorhabdus wittichii TaxID=160791 RepID=UPI0002D2592C|nr:enoyl-CoA hydratase-related protein [Rhizorhabdus wittichii]
MINFEKRGGCAIVTLARPEARNAISRALEQALYDALEEVDRDSDIRVGIVAAEGPIFCAGADLKEVGKKGNPRGEGAPKRESIVSRTHVKPLIAAVDGPALGGGMEIVLACDMVVASTAASFALSEVRWGLLAAGGGMFRLPRRLPRQIATQMLLTGAPLSAERAYALGFVNELTEAGGALEGALMIARKIAENGPLAVALSRQVMEDTVFLDEAAAWKISREVVARNFASHDAREGPRAFAERRRPEWKGV